MATTKKASGAKKGMAGNSHEEARRKEVLFIEAFLSNGGNKTDAAIKAGLSAKTAGVTGHAMFNRPNVRAEIERRSKSVAEQAGLNTLGVLTELRKMVSADLRKLFNDDGTLKDVKDWPDDVASAVSSLEVEQLFDGKGEDRRQIGYTKKLKLWDKNAAVEKAMKHLGLFEKDNAQSKPSITFTISGDDADL